MQLLATLALVAALLPPGRNVGLPDLPVTDDQGVRLELRAVATGAGPTLLLPVFTRCTGTCPMTAVFLKNALAAAAVPFRVVVFSFDPEDTEADLRQFRARFALPAEWRVVRSPDAGATKAFLDGFDFHFMRAEGGFDHPNATFALSPAGRWSATLAGSSFDGGELRTAHARAQAADDPSRSRQLAAWLVRPEAWILIACAGVLASLLALAAGRNLHAARRPQ